MSATGVQIVLCTFPDAETARQIGTTLIERQLAKCVNLIPKVESIYRWEGKVETAHEVLATFKLPQDDFEKFREALSKLHPYDVPEILALEVVDGDHSYLRWVCEDS